MTTPVQSLALVDVVTSGQFDGVIKDLATKHGIEVNDRDTVDVLQDLRILRQEGQINDLEWKSLTDMGTEDLESKPIGEQAKRQNEKARMIIHKNLQAAQDILHQESAQKTPPEGDQEIDPEERLNGHLQKEEAFGMGFSSCGFIRDMNLVGIAIRFGAGNYRLKPQSEDGKFAGTRTFAISRAFVKDLKRNPELKHLFEDEERESKQPQVESVSPLQTVIEMQKNIIESLTKQASNGNGGASATDLMKSYQDGFNSARVHYDAVIVDLRATITKQESKIDQLEDERLDYMQQLAEAGRDVIPQDDDPEAVKEPEKEPDLLQRITTLVEKVGNITTNRQATQTPAQIEHKKDTVAKHYSSNHISHLILQGFGKNETTEKVASAIGYVIENLNPIEKPAIVSAIKQYTIDQIVDYLVREKIPNAQAPLIEYMKKIVTLLKGQK